jgi:orotate phosphoribosyltransferase
LKGSVAIIDDVITAGTAIRQVIEMVEASPEAHLSAILVAIDRQERGQHELSAIQELEKQYKVPVVSIVKLEQVINFVKDSQEFADYLPKIEAYRSEYGTN